MNDFESNVIRSGGENNNDDIIMAEFRRRFLAPASEAQGGIVVSESPTIVAAKVATLSMPFILAAGAVAGTGGGFLGCAVMAAYAVLKVIPNVVQALRESAHEVTRQLTLGDRTSLVGLERWLIKHKEQLPDYLNKLDGYEQEHLRLTALIKKINQGNLSIIKKADIDFLKSKGYKKLDPPLAKPAKIPPECFLSVWHQTQLARIFYRDIKRQAGDGANAAPRPWQWFRKKPGLGS